LIVAVPGAMPVTSPKKLTSATLSGLLVQVTAVEKSRCSGNRHAVTALVTVAIARS